VGRGPLSASSHSVSSPNDEPLLRPPYLYPLRCIGISRYTGLTEGLLLCCIRNACTWSDMNDLNWVSVFSGFLFAVS
jgi:hypothetical protein